MTGPIAWMVYTEDGKSVYVTDNPTDIKEDQQALPLYTKPPWQGLTFDDMYWISKDWIAGARWAEAKLKEKNT